MGVKKVAVAVLVAVMGLVGCGDQWLVYDDNDHSDEVNDDHVDNPFAAPESKALTALSVTPATSSVVAGQTRQLAAFGWMENGNSRDVSSSVVWTTSDEAIATVSSSGLVTTKVAGDVSIMATLDQMSASAAVDVTASGAVLTAISVEAPNPTLPAGSKMQFTAIGAYSDGSHRDITTEVDWTVSPTTVATIDQLGVATGQSVGAALVNAQESGILGSKPVTVTLATMSRIDVDPNPMSIPAGFRHQATATAVYSDGSTLDVTLLAQWQTGSSATAGVLLGNVHAHAAGTTTLSASFGGMTGQAALTVTAATLARIEISPHLLALGVGADAQLTATGVFSDDARVDMTAQVMWQSNAIGNATVSSSGAVHTTSAGVAIVTATYGAMTDSVIVTVTAAHLTGIQVPGTLTIPVGRYADLSPLGLFSDGGLLALLDVQYSSSNSAIATVSANGRITANAAGSVDITVKSGLITVVVHVTVTAVTVESVVITPIAPIVSRGASLQLTATAYYSDGTSLDVTAQAGWSTQHAATATVTNAGTKGKLSGVAVGATTVAAVIDGVTATAPVVVSPAILVSLEIAQSSMTLPRGLSAPVVVLGVYSDDSRLDLTDQVTWTSSAPATASVSGLVGSAGIVTAHAVGTAVVTARKGTLTYDVNVTVTASVLSQIQVQSSSLTVVKGLVAPAIAMGLYSDGSLVDITNQVTWTSSAPAIASVTSLLAGAGLVKGNAVGTAVVTAQMGTKSATIDVTVTPALLASLSVASPSLSIAKGLAAPVVVLGVYTDGAQLDITDTVTWSSSTPSVATAQNLALSAGLVTGHAVGTTTITATKGTTSIDVAVTVTPAILSEIQLPSAPITVIKGLFAPVVAMGLYSDGALFDITGQVTWTSSAPATASITSLVAGAGIVHGNTTGTATITAQFAGKSQSIDVTVTPAIIAALDVAQPAMTVPRGLTAPIVIMGVYTDGTSVDITDSVTWSSTNASVATAQSVIGSVGLVTGHAVGTTTITATKGSASIGVDITVTNAVLSAIQLPTTPVTVVKGLIAPVIATGVYSDGSLAEITGSVMWSSSAPAIASVSSLVVNAGIVKGEGVGSATITATLDGKTAQIPVTVTPAILDGITVTTPNLLGLLQIGAATAQGHYTDGTTVDLTASVTWGSSSPLVVSVGVGGNLLGLGLGTTTITATLGSLVGTGSVGVGGSACHLWVNEVMTGALFAPTNDWVEIYNPCSYAIDLSQIRIIYRGLVDSTDTVLVSPTGMIGPGELRLYAGQGYPGSNADARFSQDIGAGGVGIRVISTGALMDSVAFGLSLNGLGEGTLLGALTLGSSFARTQDTDVNLLDFVSDFTPTPRQAN